MEREQNDIRLTDTGEAILPVDLQVVWSNRMIVAFANAKGGVGKSTIACHLVIWASDLGIRTALIDADTLCSSSQWITKASSTVTVRVASTPEECRTEAKELRQSHELIVCDGPSGFGDVSRTLFYLADLAILPLMPSILDLRSIHLAVRELKSAQGLNSERPEGRIVLNKMRTRYVAVENFLDTTRSLEVPVATTVLRDARSYRDAAIQATSVSRLGSRGQDAAVEIDSLFRELLGDRLEGLISGNEVLRERQRPKQEER